MVFILQSQGSCTQSCFLSVRLILSTFAFHSFLPCPLLDYLHMNAYYRAGVSASYYAYQQLRSVILCIPQNIEYGRTGSLSENAKFWCFSRLSASAPLSASASDPPNCRSKQFYSDLWPFFFNSNQLVIRSITWFESILLLWKFM